MRSVKSIKSRNYRKSRKSKSLRKSRKSKSLKKSRKSRKKRIIKGGSNVDSEFKKTVRDLHDYMISPEKGSVQDIRLKMKI